MPPLSQAAIVLRAARGFVAACAGVAVLLGPPCGVRAETIVVDFESPLVARDIALGGNFWVNNPPVSTAGTTFSGGNYQGFAVSASTVTGTGGYFYSQAFDAASAAAEISAESNGGAGGGFGTSGSGQFAVGYNADSTIDLPPGYRPASVYATNVATTAWLLENTDPNGISFPLAEDGEQFSVIFRGWSETGGMGRELGTATLALGSYDAGTRTIVKDWTLVDLTSLGAAASISLDFSSYDVLTIGEYTYISTPTYVALDNLTLVSVPEPAGWTLLAAGAVATAIACRLRGRRHGR